MDKKLLFKKITASFMCLSFLSMQAVMAADMTGTVLENNFGGADITGSQGGFTGFEKPSANEANLNFNNDAVINWGHLNVGSGQSLNFVNGNFAVLNNVLHGMSTFAGKVNGQQGAIIIANPNGMLMQGGSFNTAGTLLLTTQDLTQKFSFDENKKLNIDLNDPVFKDNTFSVIALTAAGNVKSSIEAGDINIIAKGISIENADLFAKNNGGTIKLSTIDGANFYGTKQQLNTDGSKSLVGREQGNAYNLLVGKSSLKTNDGTISIKASHKTPSATNSSVAVLYSNIIDSDTSINSAGNVIVQKTETTRANGNANLDINNNGYTVVYSNTKINGDLNITSKADIDVRDTSANSANLTSNESHVTVWSTNTFNEDLNITAHDEVVIGNAPDDHTRFYDTDISAKNINLTSKNGNVGISGKVSATDKITINAKGSIYSAEDLGDGAMMSAKEYDLTAGKNIGSVKAVTDPEGLPQLDYSNAVKGKTSPEFSELGGLSVKGTTQPQTYADVKLNANNANIAANGAIKLSNKDASKNDIQNDLIVNSDLAVGINGIKVGNDADIFGEVAVFSIGGLQVDHDARISSNGDIGVYDTIVGNKLVAHANGFVDVRDISANSADLTSNESYVSIWGTNIINEVLNITAHDEVVIGNAPSVHTEFYPTEVNAKNINLTSKNGNVGISGKVSATDKITVNAKGSIYSAENLGDGAMISAKEYDLTAGKDIGSVKAVTNPIAQPQLDYSNAVKGITSPEFSELGALSVKGGSAKLKVNGSANIKSANDVAVTASTVGKDLILASDKNANVNNVVVGKNLTANADNRMVVNNIQAVNADLEGKNILISGNNTLTGDITATASNLLGVGTINDTMSGFEPASLTAQNVTLTSTNGSIGIAALVTADDKITISAGNGSIYTAAAAIAENQSILNAPLYDLTAKNDIADIPATQENLMALLSGNKPVKTDKTTIAGGDLKVNANNAKIKSNGDVNVVNGSEVKGNFDLKSTGNANLDSTKAGSLNVDADGNLKANDLTADNATLASKGHMNVSGTNNIAETFNATADNYIVIGDTNADESAFENTTLNAKDINITSTNGNVGLAGVITAENSVVIVADKANGKGSIYTAANALVDGENILTAQAYELNVQDEIADITTTKEAKAVDFMDAVRNGREHQTTDKVAIAGGNLKVKADKADIKANGDVEVKKGSDIKSELNLESTGNVNMDSTKGGDLNVKADGNITANDLNAKNVDLKSGDHIIVTGKNEVKETFKAESENYMIIGNEKNEFTGFVDTTLNAKNVELKSENGNVGIAAVVTADEKIAITAGNGSIYTAANSIADGENLLNAAEYELVAKDEIADIVPTEDRIAYEFIDAVINGRKPAETGKVTVKGGDMTVEADKAQIKSEEDLNINSGKVNDLEVKGDDGVKIGKDVDFGKLDAEAKDVELERSGDYTVDPETPIKLKGEESVTVKTDGTLIVNNLTDDSIIDAPNKNFEGQDVLVKDSDFTGSNVDVKGQDLVNIDTVTADNLHIDTKGDVTVDHTNVEGTLEINNAHDVDIDHTNTGHLAVVNPEDNPYHEVHIQNTNADSTEFTNGDDVYIDISNGSIFGNDRDAILGSGTNTRIHIYPDLNTPGGNDWGTGNDDNNLLSDDSDATRLMNEFRTTGVDTIMGEDFAPIAFAAHEGRKAGIVRKRIGEAVYKDLEQTVHVTERFNMHD